MNIGELAKRTGLTSSRIRFYERAGLLQAVDRRANGYRTYPPQAVLVLELITTAQQAGFSLDEIRKLLPPGLDRWDYAGLVEALRRKVADIEALEGRLKQSKAQLAALLAEIEAKPDDMDCAANARRVLSHVLGDKAGGGEIPIGDGGLLAKKDPAARGHGRLKAAWIDLRWIDRQEAPCSLLARPTAPTGPLSRPRNPAPAASPSPP